MKKLKEKKGSKIIAGALPLVMLFLFIAPNLNADECSDAFRACLKDFGLFSASIVVGGLASLTPVGALVGIIAGLRVGTKGLGFCLNGYSFCQKYVI